MSDGHFRSLQPRNGQRLLQKSASKKVLHFEKSRTKIPLVMGFPLNCSIALIVTRMTLSCLYFHGSIQFVQFSHLVHQVRNILIEVNFYSHNIVFIL